MRMIKSKIWTLFALLSITLSPFAHANKIMDSILGKGTLEMTNDISGFLLILAPVIGGALAAYFLIRRSSANEQEGHMWNKRITIAIICTVCVFLASGIITLATSYYK